MIRIIIFTMVLFSSCSLLPEKEIDANKVIEPIKAMSKLGTTEYSLSKVIAGEDNQWYTIGTRKFMMTCKAQVVAGIDASQIQFTEVNTREKKIKLTIPPAEIITFNIQPDGFNFVDEDLGSFRGKFTTAEINEYQVFAEKKIKEQLVQINILAEAEKNAILFLDKILRAGGFVSVEINTSAQKVLP